nr:MAG TPA: hypothetical protein [Caudoviricetes sp.]
MLALFGQHNFVYFSAKLNFSCIIYYRNCFRGIS